VVRDLRGNIGISAVIAALTPNKRDFAASARPSVTHVQLALFGFLATQCLSPM
jgi:hypothetical protein